MTHEQASDKGELYYKTKTVGEPVTKPNGWPLELRTYADNTLFVRDGPMSTCYLAHEVQIIGAGSIDAGRIIIGQLYYDADPTDIYAGQRAVQALLQIE
jgi:hypothetical protein